MKPILAVCISALLYGHTLGYYLPVNYGLNEFTGESCACSAKSPEYSHNYAIDGPPQQEAADDVKYKFDFEVQEPRPAEDSERELKSYNYQIRAPPSEVEPDQTKYKFDYTLQAPVEERPVEQPERSMYTKVDRMIQDKPECSCRLGAPCTCGHTPEQCSVQCNAGSAHSHQQNSPYALPVHYDGDASSSFVVYEFPEQQEYSNRHVRQVLIPQLPPMPADHPLAPLNDRFRAATDAIRDHFSAVLTPDGGEQRVGASLDSSALKDKFTTLADKIGTHATGIVKGFAQHFSREKRDVSEQQQQQQQPEQEQRRNDDKRIPMLRVNEYDEASRDNSRFSKYLSNSRVELKAAEKPEHNPTGLKDEKESLCHKCGAAVCDSMCKRCGEHQPQYFEYVDGTPISFYPGAVQAVTQRDESSEAPRYIYDRYGHRYVESNGNLRLIAPQYQEAIVGDQPNFAGLADILTENQEVMHAINVYPGRFMPDPADLVDDGIKLVRGLARRDTDGMSEDNKRPEENQARKQSPRSMYQVVPMKYDGKDGKLVVKVYSAAKNNDKTKPEERKNRDVNGMAVEPNAVARTTDVMPPSESDKSKPTIKKFTKNHRDYEIISFDDYKGNSDEDVRQVLDYIYGKKSW